jgi:hypothetical protein
MDISEQLDDTEQARFGHAIGWHDTHPSPSLAISEDEVLDYLEGGDKPVGLETQARSVIEQEHERDGPLPSWVRSLQYREDIGRTERFNKQAGGSFKTLFLSEDRETLLCYARHHSSYSERAHAIDVYLSNIDACHDRGIPTAFDTYQRTDIEVDGQELPALELEYNEAIVPFPSDENEWQRLYVDEKQREGFRERRDEIEEDLRSMLSDGEIAYTAASELSDLSTYGIDLTSMDVIVRDIGEYQLCPEMPYSTTEELYQTVTE